MRFDVPDAVAGRARSLGPAGVAWLAGLDTAVGALEVRWALRASAVLRGGSESLVLEVARADGSAAVLKLGLPGSADLAVEAKVLALADGRGYVRALAHDAQANALLLERLGPALAQRRAAVEGDGSFDAALCRALLTAWRPLDENPGLTTGAEKAAWLADFVRSRFARLAPDAAPRLLDATLERCATRAAAHDPARAVLVHGDPHAHNALLEPGLPETQEVCRFVDPDGLYAEPEYDLGVIAREWSDAVFLADPCGEHARRCEALAAATGCDARAIADWGAIERVSTALTCLEIGLDDAGRRLLRAAERLDAGL